MKAKDFFKLCKEEFFYLLKDFNFKISEEKELECSYQVSMKNSTTGIIITFDFREFYVFLKICKLENGKFIKDIKEIKTKSKINNFDYENLLLIRSPKSIYPRYTDDTILNDALIENIVRFHAKNLKETAYDILIGDFHIFQELEKIVKQRAVTQ